MNKPITAITNQEEYDQALVVLDGLMDAEPGSKEEVELERLSTIIENYEIEHFPIDEPSPEALARFRIQQQYLDEENYPTAEALEKIKTWEIQSNYDCVELLQFCEPLWSYPDCFTCENGVYTLVTGGS